MSNIEIKEILPFLVPFIIVQFVLLGVTIRHFNT